MLNELKAVAILRKAEAWFFCGFDWWNGGKRCRRLNFTHITKLHSTIWRRPSSIHAVLRLSSLLELGRVLLRCFIERRPNNSFLYLAPSTHIFNQLKHHAGHTDVLLHTTMMTYQKLCLLHEDELGKLEPDYIILDEFHRCGADDWGSAVDHLLALYVECFLIGFTATPVRYLDKAGTRDMSEELFSRKYCKLLYLQDAINDKVLPVPHYVLGDILMNERVSSLEPH